LVQPELAANDTASQYFHLSPWSFWACEESS
jgi:hypothetical protein